MNNKYMESNKLDKSFFEEWSKDYDYRRNKSFLEKSKKYMACIVEQFQHRKSHFLEIGLGTGEISRLQARSFIFHLAPTSQKEC